MAVESLTSLISALRSETANASIISERLGSLLQKIVDAIRTTSDGNINIVCDAVDDELRVKGASALVEAASFQSSSDTLVNLTTLRTTRIR